MVSPATGGSVTFAASFPPSSSHRPGEGGKRQGSKEHRLGEFSLGACPAHAVHLGEAIISSRHYSSE